MKKLLIIINILLSFSLLPFCVSHFLVKQAYAGVTHTDNEDSDDEEDESESDEKSDDDNSDEKKSIKQTIKESAQGVLNSVIEGTIKAIGNSVAKGNSESGNNLNNPTSDRDVDLNSPNSESQNENQYQDTSSRTRKRITDYRYTPTFKETQPVEDVDARSDKSKPEKTEPKEQKKEPLLW